MNEQNIIKSEIEIGGSDQMFNFAISRDLQKISGQKSQICILTNLINGLDGRKMSKSFNNCIFINDEPSDVFGKTMSISDKLMLEWWSIFIVEDFNSEINPIDNKKRLAWQITNIIWGQELANKAQGWFENIIQNKNGPSDMGETTETNLINVIVKSISCSKSHAKRLLEQKGIKVNGNIIINDCKLNKNDVIQIGKRNWVKIV